jgi:hypothetical protein
MVLKIIIIAILISSSISINGQITNVILPKPKIEEKNLSSLYFQNGEKIQVINESNTNFEDLWSKFSNKPIVLVTNSNEYLYNYKAVNDPRNICPQGTRVLTRKDLINVNGKFNNYPTLNRSNDLLFYKTKILNNNSDCENFNKLDIEPNEEGFIALKGPLSSNSDHQKFMPVVGYYLGVQNSLNFSYLTYNQGFPVRCIEDHNYKEYFKNNHFLYCELAPNLCNDLNDQILKKVTNFKNLEQNEKLLFSCELIFDENGKNISILKTQQSKKNNSLQNELSSVVKSWDKFLFYDDIKIKCSYEINLKLERLNDSKSKFENLYFSKLVDKKINNIDLNSTYLKRAIDKDFKFNYKTKSYYIELTGTSQKNLVFNVINKVKGRGPVYSLLSIVPGLGQLKVKHDGYRKVRLWHFSVPIGAISIASKLYSNYYYSKFGKDLNGSSAPTFFKNANLAQKVFVSSLGVYSFMSLIDFSITFTIGCKNKKLQHSVNKQILK